MFGIGKLSRRLNELNDTISEIGDRLCEQLGAATDAMERFADAAEAHLWYTAGRPTGIRSIKIDTQEMDGMVISNVTVELLPTADDAVSQVVTVAVDGFQTAEIPVPKPETEVKFAVPADSTINMSVAAKDFRGNTSGSFTVEPFVAVDTAAPDTPAGIGAVRVNDTETAQPGYTELLPV